MAKIKWEVSSECTSECEVIANTRAMAVAIVESEWLKFRDYEAELVGTINEDGSIFTRSVVPEFTARKLKS